MKRSKEKKEREGGTFEIIADKVFVLAAKEVLEKPRADGGGFHGC